MMKRSNWLAILGLSFLLLSTAIYFLHFVIFHDSYFIFKYLVAQLGFLPISTLLVTIVLNQLMGKREKTLRMQKLNMVIGAFFSDVGTDLLRSFAENDPEAKHYGDSVKMKPSWQDKDFERFKKQLKDFKPDVITNVEQLIDLQSFLARRRNHLFRLLENPNLLEHESFSQLLRAVFHLTEELDGRTDLSNLQKSDHAHLRNDIKRVYALLIIEWFNYMQHLCKHYPYLFSLSIRTNPFNPEASVEIME